tara:strand:- start:1251 stop:1505 length:255 start_codon:yes stop_codon:yes gene_type:complete
MKKSELRKIIKEEIQYSLKEYERGDLTQGMDLEQPLNDLKAAFEEWKNNPYTKEEEIEPAKKELLNFVIGFIEHDIIRIPYKFK